MFSLLGIGPMASVFLKSWLLHSSLSGVTGCSLPGFLLAGWRKAIQHLQRSIPSSYSWTQSSWVNLPFSRKPNSCLYQETLIAYQQETSRPMRALPDIPFTAVVLILSESQNEKTLVLIYRKNRLKHMTIQLFPIVLWFLGYFRK